MRRLALLLAAPLALWVILAVPVKYLADDENAWVHSGVAMLLCLVPAALTFVWADRTIRRDPQQGAMILLGSTGVRLFGVLAVALLLMNSVPVFGLGRFLIWLVVFYLFTLALEMTLLLTGRTSPDSNP
jgi:hypothetical protein